MPIWDFHCAKCKKTTELSFPTFDRSKKAKCPNCKGKVERLASSGLIEFKGSGFYRTTYRKNPTTNAS